MAQDNQTQLMQAMRLDPLQLLQYVPAHRIVICKVCRYAIQPLAIPRHLKDYHQIFRRDRRPFMRYVASLDLREPQDVVMPTIPVAPLPFLRIIDGFSCCIPGCRYLSISVKLLTTHWNAMHEGSNQTDIRWHRVKLQTFFRGNRVKYFEVSQPASEQEWTDVHNSDGSIQGTKASYYHSYIALPGI
jgi:hypothetical protein